MQNKIKCDRQTDKFDFDTCLMCKHYRSGESLKRRWRCKLNNGSAAERQAFRRIWVEENLIAVNILVESNRAEIIIEYVGKKKRGKRDDENADNAG